MGVFCLRQRSFFMAKTKEQKTKAVEKGVADLKKSKTVLLVDFTGTSTGKLNEFRRAVRGAGGAFQVVKKRLLKFIFGKESIDFDPKNFQGQAGVVFSPQDVYETSSLIYKSTQGAETFRFLGGFEVQEKRFIESKEILKLGKLPSREVLLSQLVGMISAPIKMFMSVLEQKSKMVESK